MAGFFLFNSFLQFVAKNFGNLFEGAGIGAKKASLNSGIERFGWYGHILGMAVSVTEISKVEEINVHEFLIFLSYKKAENKMNNYVDSH